MIKATGKIIEGFNYVPMNSYSIKDMPVNQVTEYKKQFHDWYSRYSFHAFVTLTLTDENLDTTSIDLRLRNWIRELHKFEKMQFCYMGIITKHYGHSRKHIHLLMYGKNRSGKMMSDCNLNFFRLFWRSSVDMKFIYNSKELNDYIVYRNMGASFEFVNPYNPRLLKEILRINININPEAKSILEKLRGPNYIDKSSCSI